LRLAREPGQETDAYTYNAVGNRLTKDSDDYTYDAAEQLTDLEGTTFDYDDNGNQTDRGSDTFGPGPIADHPGLLSLKGGRVLADAVAARSLGRTRREGACCPARTRRHGTASASRRSPGRSKTPASCTT
jgi:hypothetical protein